MTRWVWWAVGAVLVVVVVGELLAPRLVERALLRSLGSCVTAEELEVTNLERPLLPQLVRGRARDVELAVSGMVVGDLRVDEVTVRAPLVDLPWALGEERTAPVEVEASVVAPDARAALAEVMPFGLQPTLEFSGGEVVVGVAGFGLDARLVPVWDARRIGLVPGLGPPEWWTGLGLSLSAELPAGVRVLDVDVGEGRARIEGRVDLTELDVGDGAGCGMPVGAARAPGDDGRPA